MRVLVGGTVTTPAKDMVHKGPQSLIAALRRPNGPWPIVPRVDDRGVALRYRPGFVSGATVSLAVDDLADARFQEVPGVPGAGRQGVVELGWSW